MQAEAAFGAQPISPSLHGDRLRRAVSDHGKAAWCYFVPFLCCYNLPPARVVLVAERGGSICLLVARSGDRGVSADMMLPPLPFSCEVMAGLLDDIRGYNEGRPGRILWVDEEDAGRMGEDRFVLETKDSEYLYAPGAVAAATGRRYRDLRKRLRRFEKRDTDSRFRPMSGDDVADCHVLLKHWRRRQGRRHPFLLDWGYTRAALDRFCGFDREQLQGWCVEMEGRIAGFAMAGPIRDDLACFFVAKADPDVPGLSEYLRWHVHRALAEYDMVNDAGDLGLPGLRQHKGKFRPVARLPVYTAQARPMEHA